MFKFIAVFIILTTIALPKTALSQIKVPPEKFKMDNFLMQHGDLKTTLSLEKDFHHALRRKDLVWMKSRAEKFKSDLWDFMDAIEKQEEIAPDTVLAMGPCQYASFALHQAIFLASLKTKLARKNHSDFEKIEPKTYQKFSVNIRRCELIKGSALSERLLVSE